MRDRFLFFLNSQTIIYQEINESLISFKFSGVSFIFESSTDDKSYFRILVPNIESKTTIDENILRKMSILSSKFRVAKCVIINDSQVWLSAESFVFSEENISHLFQRILILLVQMLNDYRNNEGLQQ